MQTCEAPDFGGLHKNKNCALPLKSTEEVIQQVEQLINSTDPQHKFDENIFAIRDTILEKIKRVEDFHSKF